MRGFWLGILWPEQERRSDVGLNAHERLRDALRTQKTSQKNGRSEERPSSGRKRPGRAAASQSKIAIPRCNNMKKLQCVCKAQSITILDKTPQKPWKNMSHLPGFWLFCCLFQHLCNAIIAKVL